MTQLQLDNLARIVFESLAELGLGADGTSFPAADLIGSEKVALTSLDAARPLLESISDLQPESRDGAYKRQVGAYLHGCP